MTDTATERVAPYDASIAAGYTRRAFNHTLLRISLAGWLLCTALWLPGESRANPLPDANLRIASESLLLGREQVAEVHAIERSVAKEMAALVAFRGEVFLIVSRRPG